MKPSNEFALTRLDEWIEARYEVKYTQEVAAEIAEFFAGSLMRLDLPEKALHNAFATLGLLHPRLLQKGGLPKFVDHYPNSEALATTGAVGDFDLAELSDTDRREYIEPMLQPVLKLKRFIDYLDDFANGGALPKEITDELIEVAFIRILGGIEGYNALALETLKGLPALFDLLYIHGEINEYPDWIHDLCTVYATGVIMQNEAVFGDLK